MLLDGGEVEIGLESTIIDLSRPEPVILRPGRITYDDIKPFVPRLRGNYSISKNDLSRPKAPGMKYKHYAPDGDVRYLPEGDAGANMHGWGGLWGGYSVSSGCKNPEAALKLLDYLVSEEGSMLRYYGIEGVHYTKTSDGIEITDENIAERKKEPVNRAFTGCFVFIINRPNRLFLPNRFGRALFLFPKARFCRFQEHKLGRRYRAPYSRFALQAELLFRCRGSP